MLICIILLISETGSLFVRLFFLLCVACSHRMPISLLGDLSLLMSFICALNKPQLKACYMLDTVLGPWEYRGELTQPLPS